MSVLITVFTPTYNRRNCIHKCYESMCRQSSFNFKWLIIDDGSTDNTEEIVRKWQNEEQRFEIIYDYKENGGLHTGYNRGIELADTELFMCIDSDDWLPDDAIKTIETMWISIKEKGYVGIMGIDRYDDGSCVGEMFPADVDEMYLYQKLTEYKIDGDKKMVHRTDLLKKVAPMAVYPGEKDYNPSYMMYQLDQFGKLFVSNECFCIVEYQPGGMSSNIYKQYRFSPNSFADTRKLYLSFPDITPSFKFRHSVHYISSCIFAKKLIKGIKESPFPGWAFVSILPGAMLSVYVWWKTRNLKKKG